jgi:hypothetical protein
MAELRAIPSLADYGPQGPAAVLIAEADAPAGVAMLALEDAGIGIRERIPFAAAGARLADHGALDLIVIDAAGAPEALFDTVLARADTLAHERPLCVVAAVTHDQLDAAMAHLMGPRTQILCDATEGDWVAALALARSQATALAGGGRAMPVMDDARREGEVARLRRLNEEVARIADTLARLTRGEETGGGVVRTPVKGYRGPDEPGGEAVEATAQEIRTVIRARRLRSQFFREELFADPAWDMLLDLYAARLEARPVSVSSLCIAAAVPPTTALRWIGTMHESGLFERHADPSDRRRAYIALSEKGVAAMRAYVTAAKRQGLGLV